MTREAFLAKLVEQGYEPSPESGNASAWITLLWPIKIGGEIKKARLSSNGVFRTKGHKFISYDSITPVGDYKEAVSFLNKLEMELDLD